MIYAAWCNKNVIDIYIYIYICFTHVFVTSGHFLNEHLKILHHYNTYNHVITISTIAIKK